MITKTRKITVAEFEAMADDPGHRYELVDGELIDMDGAPRHGIVATEFAWLLRGYVKAADLPLYVGNATGFRINAYTLRFPDVHVTAWERMAAYDEAEGAFPHFAPDVAIEVVSPSNTPAALARKTAEYFANGTRAVWIADPVSAHGKNPATRPAGAGFRRWRYTVRRAGNTGLCLPGGRYFRCAGRL